MTTSSCFILCTPYILDCDAIDEPNDCTIPISHGDLSESNLPESYKMWATNDNYLDWGDWESQGSYFDQNLGKDMDAFGTPGYWNDHGYVNTHLGGKVHFTMQCNAFLT